MTKPTFALLAAGSVLAWAADTGAQPFAFKDRDLLLVFRKPGSANLEVDIGPASTYLNALPNATINVNQYSSAQLTSAYAGLDSLSWAVLGAVRPGQGDASAPQNTLWLTRGRDDVNTPSTPWARKSNSAQSQVSSVINGIAGNGSIAGAKTWSLGTPLDPLNNTSTVVIIPSSDPNSYTALAGLLGNLGGTFGQGSVENTTPAIFSSATRSDLFEVQPGSGSASYKGYFEFRPDGTTIFQAVPEPSTYALALVGGALLFAGRRWTQRNPESDAQK